MKTKQHSNSFNQTSLNYHWNIEMTPTFISTKLQSILEFLVALKIHAIEEETKKNIIMLTPNLKSMKEVISNPLWIPIWNKLSDHSDLKVKIFYLSHFICNIQYRLSNRMIEFQNKIWFKFSDDCPLNYTFEIILKFTSTTAIVIYLYIYVENFQY